MRVIQMDSFSPPQTSFRRNSGAVPVNAAPVNAAQPSALDFLLNGRENSIRSFISKLEKDDYILAGLIIVLIFEGCDDYVLLLALGYLLIMGFITLPQMSPAS